MPATLVPLGRRHSAPPKNIRSWHSIAGIIGHLHRPKFARLPNSQPAENSYHSAWPPSVPPEYLDPVFSKSSALSLPPHQPYDCILLISSLVFPFLPAGFTSFPGQRLWRPSVYYRLLILASFVPLSHCGCRFFSLWRKKTSHYNPALIIRALSRLPLKISTHSLCEVRLSTPCMKPQCSPS